MFSLNLEEKNLFCFDLRFVTKKRLQNESAMTEFG